MPTGGFALITWLDSHITLCFTFLIPCIPIFLIYNSLILPHVNYCILAWGHTCDRIIKLQKRAIRLINLTSYNAHTEPLLKKLNLLKVTDILQLKALTFYYKYKKNQLPKYFENFFTVVPDTHSYDTRLLCLTPTLTIPDTGTLPVMSNPFAAPPKIVFGITFHSY